jgi:hypothetical protein
VIFSINFELELSHVETELNIMHLSMLSPGGGAGRAGDNRGFEFLLKYFVKHPVFQKSALLKTHQNIPVISLLPVQIPHINAS